MSKHCTNQHGFAHYILVIGIFAVVVIGGVFGTVLTARNNANVNAAQQKVTTNAKTKSKVKLNAATESKAEAASDIKPTENQTPRTSTTVTKAPSTPVSATSPSTNYSTSVNYTAPATPAASTTSQGDTYQNQLLELTNIIDSLQKNIGTSSIYITASPVSVPGPVSSATARPIVFGNDKLLAKTYFAYMQGAPINFTGSASSIAGKMAIVVASGSYSTQPSAYINKSGVLQDTAMSTYLVGYSTGGN